MNRNIKPLKESKKEMLFSGLHVLLTAGLDFSHSFRLLIEEEKEEKIRLLLKEIYASVVDGDTLNGSFARSRQFGALDCGVLRIGEETGRIAEALAFLADYYRKRIEQRRMISGAVSYPVIILVTALVVLVFMVTVIVPMFEQVYARMGSELPWLTRRIIIFSRYLPNLLLGMGGIAAVAGCCCYRWRKCGAVQAFLAVVILKLPFIGSVVRQNQQARFCKLLRLLYGSGVPLLHALELLRDIITFYPYRQSFGVIGEVLRRGGLFAAGLARFPGDNRLLCRCHRLYRADLVTWLWCRCRRHNRLVLIVVRHVPDLALRLPDLLIYSCSLIIFLQRHILFVKICRQLSSNITDMPRLIRVSCDLRLILRITYDETILMTVLCQPFSIGSITEAFLQCAAHRLAGYIQSKPRLMLAAARLCRYKIRC